MIYLRPMGGLCNRMRSIDSLISLCLKYDRDLCILWVRDPDFNCSFHKIFQDFNELAINVNIVECPRGFPESHVKKLNHFPDKEIFSQLKYHLKSILKVNIMEKGLVDILEKLNNIRGKNIWLNDDLAEIYASQEKEVMSIEEMDAQFLAAIGARQEEILANGEDAYFESCYRLFPSSRPYIHFKPLGHLRTIIKSIAKDFHNTLGLHIRRTDHKASIRTSTTEKFVTLMERELKLNPGVVFFLASDNAETKNELKRRIGERIVSREVSSFNRDDETALIEACIDLYCLAQTRKIYGSHHSSFSQTAAEIGGIELDYVL